MVRPAQIDIVYPFDALIKSHLMATSPRSALTWVRDKDVGNMIDGREKVRRLVLTLHLIGNLCRKEEESD